MKGRAYRGGEVHKKTLLGLCDDHDVMRGLSWRFPPRGVTYRGGHRSPPRQQQGVDKLPIRCIGLTLRYIGSMPPQGFVDAHITRAVGNLLIRRTRLMLCYIVQCLHKDLFSTPAVCRGGGSGVRRMTRYNATCYNFFVHVCIDVPPYRTPVDHSSSSSKD